MRLDIASLSMAILWNIIFISVVFVMEKKKAYTSRKGIQIILIFYLLGVIRFSTINRDSNIKRSFSGR